MISSSPYHDRHCTTAVRIACTPEGRDLATHITTVWCNFRYDFSGYKTFLDALIDRRPAWHSLYMQFATEIEAREKAFRRTDGR